ncbi:MAG: type IX secretion system sortase PorU, partial [Chitinophagaceae bacterium]|nr:type IX secretion system sortase PorU [Chitinophagaceae bacterium]
NNFPAPAYSGVVANQDLHSLGAADYIIVSHPDFLGAANKLADFHRNTNGFRVVVADVNLIYNEFGSGAKDISAIRDFVKMFYDRAGSNESDLPKYLLLLGQASYDYKNITSKTPRLVPTFETPESLSATSGYCTDDFYAILDNDEYIEEGRPLMDIGIGRIPATNTDQANAVIDKIIRYKSTGAFGPWRLNNVFIGDIEDNAGDHMMDADAMSKTVETASNTYRSQKVYLDNIPLVSTPGGTRAPEANKMINDNVYKGTFLINYSGHGSVYTLSGKRIVTQDDYNSWNNQYKMPILITATCDFSRFDNPALQSAGEKVLLKGNGGAIALVTTTQVVYANPNYIFNKAYLKAQFNKQEHGWYTFGDAFRVSKNEVVAAGDITNSRKFALLGDPAIVPDFPRYDVQTDSVHEVTNNDTRSLVDSVKSLGRYVVHGSVRDDHGMPLNDFNGKVNITFFDKNQILSIRTANSGNTARKISLQNNIIYKGIATVQNGHFSFEFITPKDINYEFGKGKISYYADNGIVDASGADTSFTVGGFSDDVIADEDAPLVRPFMNDSLFKNGGLTGNNSILYAIITDKSGINVSGNFVGHDLTAVLDDVVEVPYVLNDYYETAPNTYQRGYVNFPMTGLTDGIHTLRVKAWDVFNNSGEGVVQFEVMNGDIIKIRNIYSYPNPFRDRTHIVFEHNHPNEALKATVYVYNSMGSLVRTIEQQFNATGSNSAEVSWDGTGNGGEKLPQGIYPYRIRIATEKNTEDLGYQKVILQR